MNQYYKSNEKTKAEVGLRNLTLLGILEGVVMGEGWVLRRTIWHPLKSGSE